jgi:DNA-binding protein HU-beta
MTKADFIDLVQKNGEYKSKAAAEQAVKAFTSAITDALVAKESVSLVGFGTFSTLEVAEKTGTVPGTTKSYTKPAHTAPKFKIGKTLKDAVAGN